MSTCSLRIRTVTYFASLTENTLRDAVAFFESACPLLADAGFEIQSTRVATDLVERDVAFWKELDRQLAVCNLIVCTGPFTHSSEIDHILQILKETQNLFLSFAVQSDTSDALLHQLGALILRIGSETGVHGSFRFCVTSECPPYIPYFPAAFAVSSDAPSFAIGIESSGMLHDITEKEGRMDQIEESLREVLTPPLSKIESVCKEIEAKTDVHFRHIDCSLCPRLDPPPLTAFFQRYGIESFGDAGTLSICAAITRALKSVPVCRGGFCGLMLPVCEDAGLIKAAEAGAFGIADLLYYSTVCACGLDCIPVPGYTQDSKENKERELKIGSYLRDMLSIATTLKKPLSCRLLPVPNKGAGEKTNFHFQHLIDGCIMKL